MVNFDLDAKTVTYAELMDRAVAEFKSGWAEADEHGLVGWRVERGLEKVFAALGIELHDSVRHVVAPEFQRCPEHEGGGHQCRHWLGSVHNHEVEYIPWSGDDPKTPITLVVGRRPVPEGVDFA